MKWFTRRTTPIPTPPYRTTADVYAAARENGAIRPEAERELTREQRWHARDCDSLSHGDAAHALAHGDDHAAIVHELDRLNSTLRELLEMLYQRLPPS